MKTALITGITGQDGAYLAAFLLQQNYKVYGTYRRTSSPNFWRIEYLGIRDHPHLHLVPYDLTDAGAAYRMIEKTEADEVYNLAAQSYVGVSFDQPSSTAQMTALGPLNLLEAIRSINPQIKFYQASSSEMFGMVQSVPQTESTAFYPRSPYGIAKLYAHWMCVHYREAYGIFASSGILFNHESPLRGHDFVTRKITDGLARVKCGTLDCLRLGNLDARRDWGFAGDYVVGMWQMLQHSHADTFVLATGRSETVRHFATLAATAAGFDPEWLGAGRDEIARDRLSGQTIISSNQDYFRPTEVDLLIGDAQKAAALLNWRPTITLEQLCDRMMRADLNRHQNICVTRSAKSAINGETS